MLDVGCGPGLLMLQLAELYPSATFLGIDVVETGGLNTARRLAGERGFRGTHYDAGDEGRGDLFP